MGENAKPKNGLYNMLVGTYTTGTSEGIYVFEFNENTGEVVAKSEITNVKNPSYLAISPDRSMVYAVNEINGENAGFVSCFRFKPLSGDLEFVNKVPSLGSDPCYLEISNSILAVGNYSSGTAAVYDLAPDGSLGGLLLSVKHQGSGADPQRQASPHIHCTTFSPGGDVLFMVDLGTDTVLSYPVNAIFQKEKVQGHAAIETEPGAGPRHLIFNKTYTNAYLINEMEGSINVYDITSGTMVLRQTVVLARPEFRGAVSGGELQFSPCGKFLYASNRAEANEMIVFEVKEYELLSAIQHISSGGRTPRHFAISENGKYILVANKDSANLVVFERNTDTGFLKPTGLEVEIDQPSFILLSPIDAPA